MGSLTDWGSDLNAADPAAPPAGPTQPFAVAPAKRGPLAAWGDDLGVDHAARANSNLLNAAQMNPDEQQKALAAAQQIGVPLPATAADPNYWDAQARLSRNQQTLDANPVTQAWVGENPLAARLANDDFEKLGTIEQLWTALKSGAAEGVLGNEIGRLGTSKQAAMGGDTPDIDNQVRALNAQIQALPKPNGAAGFAKAFTGFATAMLDNAVHGGTAGAVAGAAVGAVATPEALGAGAIPGALAGGAMGTFLDMADTAAGNAYLKLDGLRGADGAPLSEPAKQFGAIFTGVATYALGKYGGDIASKAIGETAESLAAAAIERAVATPTFAAAIGNATRGLAWGTAQGAGLNFAMEGSSIIGEELAKALSSGDFRTNPQEIIQRLEDAAVSGALLFGALHTATAGLGAIGDFRAARMAEARTAMLENILNASSESKLHDRNLQLFQDFLQKQTDGSPVESLFVPVAKVLELYQTHGLDPSNLKGGDPIFGFVKDMREQIDQARLTNGDVVIPTADFVAHLAGSDIAKKLLPDIRVGQDAMSLNDAKEYQKDHEKALAEGAAGIKEGAEDSPQQKIYADFKGQLTEAGISSTAAHQYATLTAAHYRARAERLGTDPLALYQEAGLRVERGGGEAGRVDPGKREEAIATLQKLALGEGRPVLFQDKKPPAPKQPPTVAERLKDMDLLEELHIMRTETGWGERGGHIIRNAQGDVVDRTKWIPNASWWPGRPKKLKEREILPAIEKALENKPLTAHEENLIHYMLDVAEERQRSAPFMPSDEEMRKVGSPWDEAPELAMVARLNEDTVERLAIQYADDDAAFLRAVKEALYAQDQSAAARRRSEAGAPETRANDNPDAAGEWKPDEFEQSGLGAAVGADGNERPAELEQGDTEGKQPRGSIRFGDGKTLISIFRDHDLSTVLHETGHLWLEELIRDAAREDAHPQIKDDLATVMQWLGVDSPAAIEREHHEQFARGAESYFMEGKAPSLALGQVFARFKAWLSAIYGAVRSLNAPISDEMRSVFDRMVASEEEIAHAQKAQYVEQLFKDPEQAGMTQAEFDAYTRAINNAANSANAGLLAKMLEKVKRERTAEFKAERKRMTDEATADIDARPEMQALKAMRDPGKDAPKLSAPLLETTYVGHDVVRELPKGITSEDGVHPDHIAEMFGFASGDELVRKLLDLEEMRRARVLETGENVNLRKMLIGDAVDARMANTHGDILNDGSIRDEAIAAVHNTEQQRVLAIELRALAKKAGATSLPVDVTKEWAQRQVEARRVSDAVNADRFARDEARAGRDVQRLLLKGEFAEAYLAKRAQVMNHALYMAASDARQYVEKSEGLMQRLAAKSAHAGIAQDYTDQIHALLERFGFKTAREGDELMRGLNGRSLADFAADKFASGIELPLTDFLTGPSGGDARALKLADFRELASMVRSLQHLGREEMHIRIGDKIEEKEAAIADMVGALSHLKQREQSDFYRPEDKGALNAKKEKAFSWMRSLNASLLKMEQLFDWLDGDNPNGPFNRLIFRPLKDAAHWENEGRAKLVEMFRDIKKAMPEGWTKRLDDHVDSNLVNPDTGNAFKFTRKRMLSIALNWGTADNATKLSDGYKWDPKAVQSFLDKNMTEHDWKFVQAIWEAFEALRPQIDELQRRVTGVGIEFVDGRSIRTPFGDIGGKYFPLVYDSTKSITAERNAERSRDSLLESQYQRATTRNGSTISRVQGVEMPIELSLDIIPWKMAQTIHDLAFREALMGADRLLADRRVIKALDDSIGAEYRKAMRPWLQHIANSANINDRAMAWGDRFLNAARTNMVMVGIGFRVTTMLKHGFTALSNSVGELGPRWMGAGLKELFGTPQQTKRTWDWVMATSNELKFRKDQYDRDVAGGMRGVTGEKALATVNRKLQEYGHYGVASLDMLSAVPTWIGAFRKAQSENMEHADAVYYADKMVRKAHGAQGITDKAAFQNSQSQIWKLTGMFYGFFNHIYNRQADTVRRASMIPDKVHAGDFKGAGNDFAQVLARSVYYLIIPALAEAMWTHGLPNENKDEGWLEWAGKAVLAEIPAGIPVLRDIAKAAIEGRDYEISPVARAVSTLLGSGRDLASAVGLREKDPSSRSVQHAIESFGYLTGAPTGQAGAAAQFLWDVEHGDQDPKDLAEWIQGLMHGKTEQAK